MIKPKVRRKKKPNLRKLKKAKRRKPSPKRKKRESLPKEMKIVKTVVNASKKNRLAPAMTAAQVHPVKVRLLTVSMKVTLLRSMKKTILNGTVPTCQPIHATNSPRELSSISSSSRI
jgi:hypothetical protein